MPEAVSRRDVELVMAQTDCTMEQATEALIRNGGDDLVSAIVELMA